MNIVSESSNKSVLFVTTKQLSYIRNNQEIEILSEATENLFVAGSNDKSYFKRVLTAYILSIYYCIFKRIDIVFVGFAPQLMYPLFWLYKIKNRPLYIDFFISLYDTFVWDRKKFKPRSLVAKCLYKLDYWTIHKADDYIADTKAHKKYFIKRFKISKNKGNVMYLKANTDIYYKRKIEKPEIYKDKFLVLYFGSILPLQGVEVILECIESMKNNKSIHFIMIGPIDVKYNKPETENVTYIEWLSEERLAQQIEIADLCLAGHFSSTIGKARRTIPGKVYIYKAMDKRIVLGNSPANRELFEEKEPFYYVEQGNAEALKQVIEKIYKAQLKEE